MLDERELGAENSTSFHLRKWYLDCVDEGGNVAIAYWARLRWRYIKLYYSSASFNGVERHSLRRCDEPFRRAAALSWRSSSLDLNVEMEAKEGPFRRRLLESRDGWVDWWCEMPRAKATIGGVSGDGYAEVLEMTLPPWKLPIDELRWGRFIGGETSMVWIDWRGAAPQTVILHDGSRVDGVVSDDAVHVDGATLRFDRERVIRSSPLGDALPLLGMLLPRRVRRAREQKWCGRGALGAVDGWAVHEMVTFR